MGPEAKGAAVPRVTGLSFDPRSCLIFVPPEQGVEGALYTAIAVPEGQAPSEYSPRGSSPQATFPIEGMQAGARDMVYLQYNAAVGASEWSEGLPVQVEGNPALDPESIQKALQSLRISSEPSPITC